MAASPGTKLAHYEILELIGKGGMGEVYRARDTTLGREVAIKILPDDVAHDRERLARLEREARLLASINHPNVATLYGMETAGDIRFLVMEIVEGQTLRERIARRALTVNEVVALFAQIADGLEAAHERGVVHRDLKPANVVVSAEGRVKILDFGLAKVMRADVVDDDGSAPTRTRRATDAGVLLGTAAYMSPEQARGQTVDARTDVWAFGCCLYESLTGRSPFLRETPSDTIAAILEHEPDARRLTSLPTAVQRLVRRCLEKSPRERIHHIADARIELEAPLAESARPEAARRPLLPWLVAGVSVVGLVVGFLSRREDTSIGRTTELTLKPSPRAPIGIPLHFELSPDGSKFGYAARSGPDEADWFVFVRDLSARESIKLEPTRGDIGRAFFSHDGQWIGYFDSGERKLKKVPVDGGSAVEIADIRGGYGQASWGADDTIVFSQSILSELWRVSASGGEAEPLTSLDEAAGETSHHWPHFLDESKNVLFSIRHASGESQIAIVDIDSGNLTRLVEGEQARYAPTGHLVFTVENAIHAIAFDRASFETFGRPVPVVDDVQGIHWTMSNNGTLVAARADFLDRTLLVVDRDGNERTLAEERRARFEDPTISPDGRQVAVTFDRDTWLYDLGRHTFSRITFDERPKHANVFSPDGRYVTFVDNRGSRIARVATTGDGEVQSLFESREDKYPNSYSPDGDVLAFTATHENTGDDIWLLPIDGEPSPFLATPSDESAARFSPDGRWIAYVSNETRRAEVFVRRFPGGEGKTQISTDGGQGPIWSRNGSELFYFIDQKLMVTSIQRDPHFRSGAPRELFTVRPGTRVTAVDHTGYDVFPDGQGFVMARDDAPGAELQIILNWFSELERLVPTKR